MYLGIHHDGGNGEKTELQTGNFHEETLQETVLYDMLHSPLKVSAISGACLGNKKLGFMTTLQ